MPKLAASTYKIRSYPEGKSIIEFHGGGRTFEVEMPTIALMGVAHSVREAAHNARIPLSKRATLGPRSLTGPSVPALEDTSGNMPLGSQFGVEISADFELISTWCNIPNKEGGGGTRFEMAQPIADADKLASDLRKAVDLARTKPAPAAGTKH